MKKNSAIEITQNLSSMEENIFLSKLLEYGRVLLYVLLGLIIAGILIYRFSSTRQEQQEADYWAAEKEFRALAGAENLNEEALAKLSAIIERHPALHEKYDALLAQILLDHGKISEALPFATKAIDRTQQENLPFYSDFANTTLLITEKQYETALKNSILLKEKMQSQNLKREERQYGDTLFALNFLRIALLQQQLGLKKEELNTWQEWKKLANTSGFEQQKVLFSEGRISLIDYIASREEALKH